MRKKNRCIPLTPSAQIYYLVDTNFLVYRLLEVSRITKEDEKKRATEAQNYWRHIDAQRKAGLAKVFTLDVCIAEAFKTLAKMYYGSNGIFPTGAHYDQAKKKFRKEICLSARDASKAKRNITFHDIQTTRDIVIGVDRFFEQTFKKKKNVGIIDLMILSSARYLIDFFGINRDSIYIITMDNPLYGLARHYTELPAAFNPDKKSDLAAKVFVKSEAS
jgi:hypothetical protein